MSYKIKRIMKPSCLKLNYILFNCESHCGLFKMASSLQLDGNIFRLENLASTLWVLAYTTPPFQKDGCYRQPLCKIILIKPLILTRSESFYPSTRLLTFSAFTVIIMKTVCTSVLHKIKNER